MKTNIGKLKNLIGIVLLVGIFFAARRIQVDDFLAQIKGYGVWGLFLFALLYVIATVSFIPGSLLTLGAGAVFGVWKGSIMVSIGSTIGAAFAFLMGRYLARDWVAKKISNSARFRAVDDAVVRDGFKMTLLIRLSPIFPFNLINYALGLTKVKFKDYVLASWIGMMPGTVMYVYLGSLAGDLAALGAGRHTKTTGEWALYGMGLIATVAITIYVTRLAKTALNLKVGS